MNLFVDVAKLLPIFISLLGWGLTPAVSLAQVSGDQTLAPGENTIVTPVGDTFTIAGGASREGNLFHSFEQFSLGENQSAFFNHDGNITTILGRVTGGDVSTIEGSIRVDTATSNADIFLINPQGIVFGPNATLDIGGSFIASTAEKVVFADGVEYSARASTVDPVRLTMSQPMGLTLGDRAGNIVNESIADGVGLRVPDRETIAFVGNGIDLSGGSLIAPSGRVALASVAPGNSVALQSPQSSVPPSWLLAYSNGVDSERLRDIQLSSGAFLDASSDFDDNPSGNIHLWGRQISVSNQGSEILVDNYGSGVGGSLFLVASEKISLEDQALVSVSVFGPGEAGDLMVAVPTGTVELLGNSELVAQSREDATGNAGALSILASDVLLQAGSTISASTFGDGNGGTVTIEVPNGVVSLLGSSELRSQSNFTSTGAGGVVRINAGTLLVREGSVVSTSTLGGGLGGQLIINTPNGTTEIAGVSPNDSDTASELSSISQGTQDAGEILITTRDLVVQDGGLIQSGSRGSGNGGRVQINASRAVRVSGEIDRSISQISSSSGGIGSSGTVDITTRQFVVSGGAAVFTSTNGSGQGGDLSVVAEEVVLTGQGLLPSGLFARTSGAGDSGRLTLTTETLSIQDGARFTVSTDDDANPDNLGTVRDAEITARSITLNNGQVTAESLSRDGGNLTLNVQEAVVLRNNSLISATAGTAAAGGDGGNVQINLPNGFLIAALDENSDIIANAFSGNGGSINITTQSILGADEGRARLENTTNDIDASSDFGNSGTIVLNNLDLDPAQGIIELPTALASPTQVAERCLVDSDQQSTFVITGQGGTPPSPRDVVRNEAGGLIDWGNDAIAQNSEVQSIPNSATPSHSPPTPLAESPLLEAKSWHRDQQGNVVLLAQAQMPFLTQSTQYHSCTHQGGR